jgi:hypothetical protein
LYLEKINQIANHDLKKLILDGKQDHDFTTACLKSTLNILAFKNVLNTDEPLSTDDITKINEHVNQKEFYTVFKLSFNEHSTFSDMLLASDIK